MILTCPFILDFEFTSSLLNYIKFQVNCFLFFCSQSNSMARSNEDEAQQEESLPADMILDKKMTLENTPDNKKQISI